MSGLISLFLRGRYRGGSSSLSFKRPVTVVWLRETKRKGSGPLISVKGENISRDDQEKWQAIVSNKLEEIEDSDFPVYQIVSLHLLPMLRDEADTRLKSPEFSQSIASMEKEIFHALLTSHHLISPNKRRSLQHWSSSLSVSGFAKVGYPGVIYIQGDKANVEEFVSNVKEMQWLALKLRFVEKLPSDISYDPSTTPAWKEFHKVGKVVEEMRRIGREQFVVEMGIGSTGVVS